MNQSHHEQNSSEICQVFNFKQRKKETMNKEYRYRKYIYWGQFAILAFFGLLFILMVGFSISFASQSSSGFFAGIFAVVALIFLVEGGFVWYLYYRLAGTSVSITDDELIYKVRKSEKRYPLETIYLKFPHIKYTGGWLKIKTRKDTIRLTFVLDDISGFLKELKTKLDNKQLSSHYDSHKLFGFLKTAIAGDQNWDRAYSIFGKIFLLSFDIGIAIFTGFILGTLPSYWKYFVFIWVGFSMFCILIANIIAEFIFMRQIANKSNEAAFTFPERNLPYEKQVFDKVFTWGSLAYIIFSLFIMLLVIFIKTLVYFDSV